jgi:hypothetical protein
MNLIPNSWGSTPLREFNPCHDQLGRFCSTPTGEKGMGGHNLSAETQRQRGWSGEGTDVFYHGSPTGDLYPGGTGVHVGTRAAAKQALEARIGIPAVGEWDGTREYGQTLLAGRRTMQAKGLFATGLNVDAPDEDYLPTPGKAKYGSGEPVTLHSKPNIFAVRVVGDMTNSPMTPHEDFKANGLMAGQLKKGTARRGYFYTNVGEDEGSISAVVPSVGHLRRVNPMPSAKGPTPSDAETEHYTRVGRLVDDYISKFGPDWLGELAKLGQSGVRTRVSA